MFGSRLFSNMTKWMMQEMALAQKNRDAEERFKAYVTYEDEMRVSPEAKEAMRNGTFFHGDNSSNNTENKG